jgi:hypothetical protein
VKDEMGSIEDLKTYLESLVPAPLILSLAVTAETCSENRETTFAGASSREFVAVIESPEIRPTIDYRWEMAFEV